MHGDARFFLGVVPCLERSWYRRRKTGLKTYVLVSAVCCLAALGVYVFVKLTEDVKETVGGVVEEAMLKVVDAATKEEIEKAPRK